MVKATPRTVWEGASRQFRQSAGAHFPNCSFRAFSLRHTFLYYHDTPDFAECRIVFVGGNKAGKVPGRSLSRFRIMHRVMPLGSIVVPNVLQSAYVLGYDAPNAQETFA